MLNRLDKTKSSLTVRIVLAHYFFVKYWWFQGEEFGDGATILVVPNLQNKQGSSAHFAVGNYFLF